MGYMPRTRNVSEQYVATGHGFGEILKATRNITLKNTLMDIQNDATFIDAQKQDKY